MAIVTNPQGEEPDVPEGVDAQAWTYALAAARAFCGWHIAPVITQTITLDARGSNVIVLPSARVVDVSEVLNDGVPVAYEWSQDGMIKREGAATPGWHHSHSYHDHGPRFSSRYRGVQVTFRHGYARLPLELEGVLVEAAQRGIGNPIAQVGQVRYATEGLTSAPSFMLDQRKLLERYAISPGA